MNDFTLVNISADSPRSVPTGPLYIASVLERAGYAVDFREYTFGSFGDLDAKKFLPTLDDSADIVGLSCISDAMPFVIDALEKFRRKHPEKTVVLGGPGPSGVAREIIRTFPFIDIVVVGEGEATIVEVMDCLRNGDRRDLAHVGGICYRDGEDVCATPVRERVADLDTLPFPDYGKLDMEKYSLVNIVFSRGCPYQCTFCDVSPMWQRKHVRRSIDGVIDEIRYLRDRYGKTNFEFTDETFVLKKDEVIRFCESLRREQLGVKWACTGRVNLITDDLLAELRSSGCQALFFGIESGSDSVLRDIRKNFTSRQALEVLTRSSESLRVVASFIWGFPTESARDLLRTMAMMIYLSQIGVDCRLNRLAPFALTPLYETYRNDLIYPEIQYVSSSTDPFKTLNYNRDIAALVEKHPSVFPEFFWLPTKQLEEKCRMVDRLGRHSHVLNLSWDEQTAGAVA